jgi:hypothetical protein
MSLTQLIVEIYHDADPVRGRIGPPGGPMQSFSGWTEFAAAIERARTAEQDPQPPPVECECGARGGRAGSTGRRNGLDESTKLRLFDRGRC